MGVPASRKPDRRGKQTRYVRSTASRCSRMRAEGRSRSRAHRHRHTTSYQTANHLSSKEAEKAVNPNREHIQTTHVPEDTEGTLNETPQGSLQIRKGNTKIYLQYEPSSLTMVIFESQCARWHNLIKCFSTWTTEQEILNKSFTGPKVKKFLKVLHHAMLSYSAYKTTN